MLTRTMALLTRAGMLMEISTRFFWRAPEWRNHVAFGEEQYILEAKLLEGYVPCKLRWEQLF